jgi:CRP-like cAMP-binding protein
MTSEAPGTSLFAHAEDSVSYPAGHVLFRQGDPDDAMYVVQEGEVEIVVNGLVVERVGPGGMFGELAMIDQQPRSSEAVVSADAKLVPVNQTRFMLMVRQTPFFAVQVMKLLAHRLRATDRLIRHAHGGTPDGGHTH